MGLETSFNYPSDLSASNPASGDARSQGDDHLRGIKNVIKTTFPNITGAVSATQTELNYVAGVTSAIQTQIDTKITAAAYATGGYGRWVELTAPTDASSAASVAFTGLASTFDQYLIELQHVIPETNGVTLQLRTSTNNGVSYDPGVSDYLYLSASGGGSSGSSIQLVSSVSNAANSGLGVIASVIIHRPSVAQRCVITGTAYSANSASVPVHGLFSGVRNTAADVDAVQFFFSSGNIASGRFRIFGRVKA